LDGNGFLNDISAFPRGKELTVPLDKRLGYPRKDLASVAEKNVLPLSRF
jgi:hypothetical protein